MPGEAAVGVAGREVKYPDSGGLIDEDDIRTLTDHLRGVSDGSRSFFPQPEEEIFQQALAAREGVRNCVAVTSCGTALDTCLALLDIGPQDEVITTPLTFIATVTSTLVRGAKVVLADIDETTLNINPARVRELITSRTRCIVPVHFAGLPCDVEAFDKLSAETGVPVVYDSAHALGVQVNGRPLASYGLASCYSFQFNKLMTCLGEGGAVMTNNDEFAELVRQFRTFGFVYPDKSTYDGGDVISAGTNYQMNKTQYVAGIAQLRKLGDVLARRRALMAHLDAALAETRGLHLPVGHGAAHGSLHYIVRVDRERTGVDGQTFRSLLRDRFGVHTRLHYPPVWTWTVLRKLGYDGADCPVAARVCPDLMTLPISPAMTTDDCDYIVHALRRCLAEVGR
jgi:dTDP-4-amino-4,6-dideoxygalactose transaminase